MKAVHSKEFWASRWDEMINTRCASDLYMNLEEELAREMKIIDEGLQAANATIPAEKYEAIKRIKAQPIIEKATAKCKAQLGLAKRIQSGDAHFGYTTQLQEIHARYEYLERFEFNCYQLAVFREKYTD